MRLFALAFAATLSLGLMQASPALAETSDVGTRETLAETAPATRSERLDALFETLTSADTVEAAKVAERAILGTWLQSGSDTVDLLMDWTLAAMDEEDYPRALDFLDRIITLEPGYVEGWNKRATVHFINDDYAKAIADLEQVLAIEPRHFGALAGLGAILSELGRDRLALNAYRQALTLDPVLNEVRKAIDDLEAKNTGRAL